MWSVAGIEHDSDSAGNQILHATLEFRRNRKIPAAFDVKPRQPADPFRSPPDGDRATEGTGAGLPVARATDDVASAARRSIR